MLVYIQYVYRTSSRREKNRSSPHHTAVKALNILDKETIENYKKEGLSHTYGSPLEEQPISQ